MRKQQREKLRARGDHLCGLVSDLFLCEAVYSNKQSTVIRGIPRVPVDVLEELANARLKLEGYRALLEGTEERYTLTIRPAAVSASFPWVNIGLFVLTSISVLFPAALNTSGEALFDDWSLIWTGLPFTFWLLAILLFHEFGHYFYSRLRGVDVSLPYFIPAPFSLFLAPLVR